MLFSVFSPEIRALAPYVNITIGPEADQGPPVNAWILGRVSQ